jgi:hypothetical protein
MALILTFYPEDKVEVVHSFQVYNANLNYVISELQKAKDAGKDYIFPPEKMEVFLQMIRSNGQARIGFEAPKSFNIIREELYKSNRVRPPHSGGIAG